MPLSDEDLRAMVRSAIARQAEQDLPEPDMAAASSPILHASHRLLSLVTGGDPDGRCLIEPAVACTHCGYCQSMGH
jgi:hypothetical protein